MKRNKIIFLLEIFIWPRVYVPLYVLRIYCIHLIFNVLFLCGGYLQIYRMICKRLDICRRVVVKYIITLYKTNQFKFNHTDLLIGRIRTGFESLYSIYYPNDHRIESDFV